MHLCLARELSSWLSTALEEHARYRDDKICIVSFVGKSPLSSNSIKSDVINEFLDRHVYLGAPVRNDNGFQIEAFFDNTSSTVFLHFISAQDVNVALAMADSDVSKRSAGSGDPQSIPATSVDSLLAEWQRELSRYWLLLSLISHIIVVVEPCCRFDTSYGRLLRQVNYLRESCHDRICSLVSSIPSLSRDWCKYGRFCSPRVLFALQRCPIRPDLGMMKRKELITRLSRSLESQIWNLFRKSRVVTNNCHQSICAIPINEPFVYVFDSAVTRTDVMSNVMAMLYRPLNNTAGAQSATSASNVLQKLFPLSTSGSSADAATAAGAGDENSTVVTAGSSTSTKRPPPTSDRGFIEFLDRHITTAQRHGFDDNSGKNIGSAYFELPRLKHWVRVVSVLYEFIIADGTSQDLCSDVDSIVNPEKEYFDSRIRRLVPSAVRVYERELPVYYPQATHELKMAQAIQYLTLQIRGEWMEAAVEKLKDKCIQHWMDGHQACETLSCTGLHCVKPIHVAVGTRTDVSPDLPRLDHNSDGRYLSTCNCGAKQVIRQDPFDLQAANYDFYLDDEFTCCRTLERYEFLLFKPPEQMDALIRDTTDETAASIKQSGGSKSVDFLTTTSDSALQHEQDVVVVDLDSAAAQQIVDAEERLLDRDNRLVMQRADRNKVEDSTGAANISPSPPDSYMHTVDALLSQPSEFTVAAAVTVDETNVVSSSVQGDTKVDEHDQQQQRNVDDSNDSESEGSSILSDLAAEMRNVPQEKTGETDDGCAITLDPDLSSQEEDAQQPGSDLDDLEDDDASGSENDEETAYEQPPLARRRHRVKQAQLSASPTEGEDETETKTQKPEKQQQQSDSEKDIVSQTEHPVEEENEDDSKDIGREKSETVEPDAELEQSMQQLDISANNTSHHSEPTATRYPAYQGKYLEYLPCNLATPGLDPAFPSWSLVCVGPSSLYAHVHGLRDQPNFSHGSNYLLPWHAKLKVVDMKAWEQHMDAINAATGTTASLASATRTRRTQPNFRRSSDGSVTVKVFVGFEYECPRGHRFMLQSADQILKHPPAASGGPKDEAPVSSDLPLWTACSCRAVPSVNAQLQRIHVVTPKAPVSVTLYPRLQPDTSVGVLFHPGTRGLLQLSYARYYVLRLPYAYIGPTGNFYPPKTQVTRGVGKLHRNALGVVEAEY